MNIAQLEARFAKRVNCLDICLRADVTFAVFIGPKPGVLRAAEAGAAIGFGLVATSFWISYLFARRSLMLGLIDGGYMTLRFIVYGLVIALIS